MKKVLKKTFLLIGILWLLLQFYPRSYSNQKLSASNFSIEKYHHVSDSVMSILVTSCYDCHSNQSTYPWYAAIQPVNWWLNKHIEEGKEELNFSLFGQYAIRRQYHKLKEIKEQVQEDEMPLTSYTLIHRKAQLSNQQKLCIENWAMALRDSFERVYPADSLKRKRK